MIGFARGRVAAGPQLPGLLVLRRRTSIGESIDALLLVDQSSEQDEWQDRVEFLPL